MEIYHKKYYTNYENNLNILLEKQLEAFLAGDQEKHEELSKDIKYQEELHFNYEFFWDNLAPISQGGGVLPSKDSLLFK